MIETSLGDSLVAFVGACAVLRFFSARPPLSDELSGARAAQTGLLALMIGRWGMVRKVVSGDALSRFAGTCSFRVDSCLGDGLSELFFESLDLLRSEFLHRIHDSSSVIIKPLKNECLPFFLRNKS